MPRYIYHCDACSHEFRALHGIKEVLTVCNLCSAEGNLHRIPQLMRTAIKRGVIKPGAIVSEFIEETEKDLKNQKEKMKEEYKS